MLAHSTNEKPIRRGDRRWFSRVMDSIEESGGIETRDLAVDRWADIVWEDQNEACFAGADAVESIQKLSAITAKLIDFSAQNVIKNVMRLNDKTETKRIIELFERSLSVDLANQAMTEETIQKLASRQSITTELSAKKRLRKIRRQAIYKINFHLKLIGDKSHRLCTPFQLADRNMQKASWRAFGESVVMKRDGQEVQLIDIMRGASKGRLAEFYTMSKGLDSYSTAAGMTWAMATLTCPPRMHPNPKNGHCTWDGTDPKQANDFLLYYWRKAEKLLRKKHGIIISGYRPGEGQGDGTPHHHTMIFAHPDDMPIIEKVLRKQIPEWRNSPGLHFELNSGKAKSYSYAAKYVIPTIGSVDSLDGEAAGNDVLRAAYGMRQFQWFGMPPMGLWRALRAIKEEPECQELKGIWHAVKRGDGHAYIGLAGGLNVKKKDRPFQVKQDGTIEYKRTDILVIETGEVVTTISKKWEWTRKIKANKTTGTIEKPATTPSTTPNSEVVGVILNCPRKPNPDLPDDLNSELIEVLGLDFRGTDPPRQRQPQNSQVFH